METTFIYPGTFCPPTYGHLDIACQAARSCAELFIICSRNPDKEENWFAAEACRDLWRSYPLPDNVKVATFEEFKTLAKPRENLVMVRGLRNMEDFNQEKSVMELNWKNFGIRSFFYIFGSSQVSGISSSLARRESAALNLPALSRLLSPLAISAVLEKSTRAKNIFLVVGRPGGGKTTFLKMLSELGADNYWINTDEFNHRLRPILEEKFGRQDLAQLAIKNGEALKEAIAGKWLEMLAESLRAAPSGSNVFVEAAYGLQADKNLFRFVGGKVIYIGCGDKENNLGRINRRQTPELAGFIDLIPGYEASLEIAKDNHLLLSSVNTDCSLEKVAEKAKRLDGLIRKGGNHAYAV